MFARGVVAAASETGHGVGEDQASPSSVQWAIVASSAGTACCASACRTRWMMSAGPFDARSATSPVQSVSSKRSTMRLAPLPRRAAPVRWYSSLPLGAALSEGVRPADDHFSAIFDNERCTVRSVEHEDGVAEHQVLEVAVDQTQDQYGRRRADGVGGVAGAPVLVRRLLDGLGNSRGAPQRSSSSRACMAVAFPSGEVSLARSVAAACRLGGLLGKRQNIRPSLRANTWVVPGGSVQRSVSLAVGAGRVTSLDYRSTVILAL
ncbi:hypothetical protein SRB5_09950 [Streptomyces sp. RB5]|uniref:Uncharacterized protein n=1 Tax=Streptomyces smaragdinus TaxID=2585196 RepID=A0A7K0CCN3_9ACTN|nr:hypothetical protein [Streptomyces smaragdinus]